jgi:hypothetical protein
MAACLAKALPSDQDAFRQHAPELILRCRIDAHPRFC